MASVVVTGGSGKAGRAAIKELLAHGHTVMNVDIAPPAEPLCHFMKADLNDQGQAVEVLRQAAGTIDRRRMSIGVPTAVVHMAGIPAPGLAPDGTVFRNNLMTTYNVFTAATLLGLDRVVWASSETTYGLPFTRNPPNFAPVTEDHSLVPESTYALAKSLCEDMAREMHRWNPGTRFVALRISNIFEAHDYAQIPSFWADPSMRRWNRRAAALPTPARRPACAAGGAPIRWPSARPSLPPPWPPSPSPTCTSFTARTSP
jgi:nucleoside-diphosphate-sugar epimerase